MRCVSCQIVLGNRRTTLPCILEFQEDIFLNYIIHKSWSLPSNSSAFTDLRGLYGWQVEITTSSILRLWSKMVGTPSRVIPLNNFNKVYFQALSFLFKLSLNRSSNRHFSLKSLGHFKSSNNNKNVA